MEPSQRLTDKQKAVYEFIRDKIRNRGYGPTVREIGQHFDIQLAQRRDVPSEGPGEEGADHPRAEHVAGDPAWRPSRCDDTGLPLAGRIAAGVLHEAIEQDERVDFSDDLRPAGIRTFSC